jgi:hypothetical protein
MLFSRRYSPSRSNGGTSSTSRLEFVLFFRTVLLICLYSRALSNRRRPAPYFGIPSSLILPRASDSAQSMAQSLTKINIWRETRSKRLLRASTPTMSNPSSTLYSVPKYSQR